MRLAAVAFLFFIGISGQQAVAKEAVLYDFEKDPQGWNIPSWALAKKDYVGEGIGISEFHSANGKYSLEFRVNFLGGREWKGAYAECTVDIQDWTDYGSIEMDVFLPEGAPRGLRARIILTIGRDWKWTEMGKALKLEPGEWTVFKADLKPDSRNWKHFITDEFRSDVKKIGIRIESNGDVVYNGPIYVDNVKLGD